MSWEAMLPLGIISAMFFVMGTSQYVVHTAIYGKPKHPRHDAWDRAMDERDARLKEEYEKSQAFDKWIFKAGCPLYASPASAS